MKRKIAAFQTDTGEMMIDSYRELIQWQSASNAAQEWWTELEGVNSSRPDLVAALASALARRTATLDDFFIICAYSNREGAKENLRLLDLSLQDVNLNQEESHDSSPTKGAFH